MALPMLFSSILRPIYFTKSISQICKVHFFKVYGFNNLSFNNFEREKHTRVTENKKNSGQTSVKTSRQNIILQLNFESHEDAAPFYALPTRTLLQIYICTKNDEKMGYCTNRLYYLSSRLRCPPEILRDSLAKRTFIYSLSFDWLERSLNVLLEFGVSSERILRDLWVLKYHHETIHDRLTRVKSLDIKTLYPWMVRCTEQVLQRFIEITQETKNILGEVESTQVYLAKRLNISPKDVEEICDRIPALKTIRVTKVHCTHDLKNATILSDFKLKSFLDFLIEEGFPLEHISKRPRVLTSSQKTIKQRIGILKCLGQNEINLNILCKSKKEFKKYCTSLEAISHFHEMKNNDKKC